MDNLSDHEKKSIKTFQEMLRILDENLTLGLDQFHNGQMSLDIIKNLMKNEILLKILPPVYLDYINNQIEITQNKPSDANVRQEIKNIWLYPDFNYLPWEEINIPDDEIDQIKNEISKIDFTLKYVDGKIYAVPVDFTMNLNEMVYDKINKYLIEECRPNFETQHITAMNSNIVYQCGDQLMILLENHNKNFKIKSNKIKSTISLDWARFSRCYVLEIECEEIDEFLKDVNEKFNLSLKPAKHITFAIVPRKIYFE